MYIATRIHKSKLIRLNRLGIFESKEKNLLKARGGQTSAYELHCSSHCVKCNLEGGFSTALVLYSLSASRKESGVGGYGREGVLKGYYGL